MQKVRSKGFGFLLGGEGLARVRIIEPRLFLLSGGVCFD
jgi:hypothetical protein